MDNNNKQQHADLNQQAANKIPKNEPMPQDDKISEDQDRQMNPNAPQTPEASDSGKPEAGRH